MAEKLNSVVDDASNSSPCEVRKAKKTRSPRVTSITVAIS